ncbi:hypothetical protein JCGZ_04720 [Jatropha curcas]|uniref:C2 domain-containing protein n=1 Tax=Jatropha curcas TaxID=180498 RepID=A0A067KPK1_JATCU|nr:protein C2-DOMAIN ABA-RELATED 7 [Jatropha curcas]KDP38077.1 hypothetical protein JCGZ_04720 [Jatropha curcas]
MEDILGLLRIRILRGRNLVDRDVGGSDPYVVVTMEPHTLKTGVVKNNCNPEWNEELTLSVTDVDVPIRLTVFDKDKFTADDKIGDAEIDIKPYIKILKMGLENLPNGCVVSRVQPNRTNCLADESHMVWNNGKIIQNMPLRLRNVESGEVEVQLEWIHVPGCKGLEIERLS